MDSGHDSRMDGVEVNEAAEILGISPAALRKRIQRGTIQSYKVDGRLYVVLTPEDYESKGQGTESQDNDDIKSNDYGDIVQTYQELVAAQKEEIEFLRQELAARTEENRRKDHLIASRDQSISTLLQKLEIPEHTGTPKEKEHIQHELDEIREEVAATRQYIDSKDEERERKAEERDQRLMETLRTLSEKKEEHPSFWQRLFGK